ncbi:MAG: hypothetical protein IK123_00640 [Lachnospiraceae bacterium]|nr:hypothetical protein [Lachnospiraceae bacterium]
MSTLETAIAFTVIITFLTFLIVCPEEIALQCIDDVRYGDEEICFYIDDSGLMDSEEIGGNESYNTSPEKLCTYLTGVSDNYRIIYGTVVSGGGDNEET